MLALYKLLWSIGRPLIYTYIQGRLKNGKEDPDRIQEKFAEFSYPKPNGFLFWIHAASVGEAQSALIMITKLQELYPNDPVMVTTGTLTSASLMAERLSGRAFHQYYPIDHPTIVTRFLDYWQPDYCLWIESELWPNMLTEIKARNIPASLVNARLSAKSYGSWRWLKRSITKLLLTFNMIMAQTDEDKERFKLLGAKNVTVTGNIKYSASPLPCDIRALETLSVSIKNRPVWLYASTHDGEEQIAADVHNSLKAHHPDLLTIIVPRHPERGASIHELLNNQAVLRSQNTQISADTEIYVADTIGELGLFYRLCPIAMIGRSLSKDGGGGHNPIEAAQLDCAIISGENVQYQKDIFNAMRDNNACTLVKNKDALINILAQFLSDPQKLDRTQKSARHFADNKTGVIDAVMKGLHPLIEARKNV